MAAAAEPGTNLVADTPDTGGSVVAAQQVPPKANMLPVVSTDGISLPNIAEVLAQPAVRKAMPAIITLLTIAIFLIAYSVTREPPTRSLYPGLSEADRQTAFDALTSAEFYVRIDDQTGDLIVRDERYHEARIFLASRGLPQEGAAGGMGSLSEDTSMTTSQFMEQVRYVSAMEQELAKSVAQI